MHEFGYKAQYMTSRRRSPRFAPKTAWLELLPSDLVRAILEACDAREVLRTQQTCQRLDELCAAVLEEYEERTIKFWQLADDDHEWLDPTYHCSEVWRTKSRWDKRRMMEKVPSLALCEMVVEGFDEGGRDDQLPDWWKRTVLKDVDLRWNAPSDEVLSGHESAVAVLDVLCRPQKFRAYAVDLPDNGDGSYTCGDSEVSWAWLRLDGGVAASGSFACSSIEEPGEGILEGRVTFFRIGDEIYLQQVSKDPLKVSDDDDKHDTMMFGKVDMLKPGQEVVITGNIGDETPRLVETGRSLKDHHDSNQYPLLKTKKGDLLLTWLNAPNRYGSGQVPFYLCHDESPSDVEEEEEEEEEEEMEEE